MSGENPGPRRVTLGADAWAVLVAEAHGLQLPAPFGPGDGPALEPAQHAAAVRALRSSALLVGDSGDLTADLHPSLRASLLVQVSPEFVIESRVGLGAEARIAHHAVQGSLASALSREQRVVDGRAELGPVTWSTMLVDDVATDVVDLFQVPDAPPAGDVLEIDPAVALAAIRALRAGRTDVAAAVVDQETVPDPLPAATEGLRSVARVDVSGPAGTTVLMAVCADGGWWAATIGGGDLELRPVDRTGLVSAVAGLLAGVLLSAAGPA